MGSPRTESPPLSCDDVALLGLLAEGLPLDAVARRLRLSERTVRRRIRHICDRLGLRTPIPAQRGIL